MLPISGSNAMTVMAVLSLFASGPPAAHAQTGAPLSRGHVALQAGFDGPEGRTGWAGAGVLDEDGKGGKALRLERPKDAAGAPSTASREIPLDGLRGSTLYCTARVKALDVGKRPQPWNGVKFMLRIDAPGGTTWPAATFGEGSFDWGRAAFMARIPADAAAAVLVVGLEETSGTAWFDDIRIAVGRLPPAPRPAGSRPPGPAWKGHDLPRLRGAMVAPDITAESLHVLGGIWGANLIRWQLIRYVAPGKETSLEEYGPWLEGELRRLDAALPACRAEGLRVVLDLHSPPGGRRTTAGYIGSDGGLFTDRAAQDAFVRAWEGMARRYGGEKQIWGFDLVNEPVEEVPGEGCEDWRGLATRAARAVHAIDPARTCIVEPADWGGPDGLRDLEPLDAPNIVYSVHMYMPFGFTHQNVYGKGPPVNYPGEIAGERWDRGRLAKALRPVIEFQETHGVHIYIGEFSAIRWAPDGSAERYLRDLISLFEERGWDWTYHAFREWQGWSVEHGEDPADGKPSPSPTGRQKLLREWFAKNRR